MRRQVLGTQKAVHCDALIGKRASGQLYGLDGARIVVDRNPPKRFRCVAAIVKGHDANNPASMRAHDLLANAA
jgi:hypothetical protein